MVNKPKPGVLRLKIITTLYDGWSQQFIVDGANKHLPPERQMHRNSICNYWNCRYPLPEDRAEAIRKFMADEGVPEGLIASAFEKVDEAEETARLMAGKLPERAEVNPDEKIESMGVVMLRRQVREHFKLAHDPFQPRTDDEPYKSRAFLECLDLVWDAIDAKAFLALSGPTGCGKSVLWMYLLRELQGSKFRDRVRVAAVRRFDKGRISESDIYYSLLADLGENDEALGRRVEASNRRVEELLVEGAGSNVTTVILINEAHDLTHSGFVQLKRLWEMFGNRPEMGYARSCAVVMLGQEELAAMLSSTRPELREVCQRAALERYGALRPDEVAKYLEHRMGGDCRRIFDESALEFFASRRLRLTPQIVNVMASRAINDAALVGAEKVTAEVASCILS